jgi:hypothetical protein
MASINSGKVMRLSSVIPGMALAALLSGCAGSGADMMSHLVTTPDKYQYYNCQQIADQVKASTAREKQLEQLMAKAGPVMSTASYDPEYVSVRGDLREMRRTAAQKHCDMKSSEPASGRVSDAIIR